MIFEVKSPILGLEQVQNVKFEQIDEMFASITCMDSPDIKLYLANPYLLREYSFNVPRYISLLLNVDGGSNLFVYNVMMMQQPLKNSRVNFLAPIVFNSDNMTCAQIALSIREYPDFKVSDEISKYVAA